MNFIFKESWYSAADAIGDSKKKADFIAMIMSFYFDDTEPDEKDGFYPFFVLIRDDMMSEKKRAKRREERKVLAQKTRKPKETPPSPPVEPRKKTRFQKPTLEDVKAYCEEKGYEKVDPEKWISFYEANGWKVGRNPMKNWKSSLAYWQNNDFNASKTKAGSLWTQEEKVSEKYMELMAEAPWK